MEILLMVVVLIGLLLLLSVAAALWGVDSRPGFGDVYGDADPARIGSLGLVS